MSSNQYELNPPPSDAVSALDFSRVPSSSKLLVASWDRNVYLYDARSQPDSASNGDGHSNGGGNDTTGSSGNLIRTFEHRAPVLDVCFGDDDSVAYTAGLDWDVRRIDLTTGTQTVLSSHAAGVKSLCYSPQHHLLISASWDSTLHLHLTNAPTHEPATLPLPAKPFAMALSPTKLVIAMSARQLHIYDLSALALATSQSAQQAPNEINLEPFQRRESSLKFMTRALACMPNDAGYASSSIEGRVAVEWFDASAESQARKYAFKCHRQPLQAEGTNGAEAAVPAEPVDVVYPVHGLAFHPIHGTFVSAGGDGFVALWDAVAKRRIRQYQRFPASVAAVGFSANGRLLAVAVSPGFEEGKNEEGAMGEGSVGIYVRELTETEAKGKSGR